MRTAMVVLGASALLGATTGTRADEFVPGHIYVTVSEFDPCDFGGEEAILEIDPVSGETSIFADSSDGICAASGLAFTPDGQHLRQLNAGYLMGPPSDGWVQEFDATGDSIVILDGEDGLEDPFGYNGLTFDTNGDLYVVNTSPSEILRFPADGGLAEVFADADDGLDGRGALAFDPISGDLFYASDLGEVILRITVAGEASVFDVPTQSGEGLQNLVFDSAGNLFVGAHGLDVPEGKMYAIYRYDQADPATKRLLAVGFTDPCCPAYWPTALTISPDETQLYFAVGDLFAPGGFLYAVDPQDGAAIVLADFSVFTDFFVMPTGIAVFDPPIDQQCDGDANHDGTVDPLDSGFVLARFGCLVGVGDPDCDAADQNGDGAVDPLDSGFVLARFGDCP